MLAENVLVFSALNIFVIYTKLRIQFDKVITDIQLPMANRSTKLFDSNVNQEDIPFLPVFQFHYKHRIYRSSSRQGDNGSQMAGGYPHKD